MSNKKIKETLSDLEHLLVSQQNEINRNKYNSRYKDTLIDTMKVKIDNLQNENINLNEEIDKMDSFECYMINILDNKELTDTEKIKLIREKI